MKTRALWVSLLVLVFLVINGAGWSSAKGFQPAQTEVQLTNAFPNLSFTQPVDLQAPGDGTGRLFIVTKPGIIYVFDNDPGVESSGVFLDITDEVNDVGGEEGLLGLAFHPNFTENGYFFVDYTASDPKRTVIARYSVSNTNPDQADAESAAVIIEIEQPYANHNGGQIVFGPDGLLYIAMGDGGSAGDPDGNGQDTSTLLGALLRIDVDNPDTGLNYGVPDDNPFASDESGRGEIYVYGLRNPWRFSWDPETEWLWLADVGQNEVEEIDIIQKGGNYGWNIMEGDQCYSPSVGCNTTGLIDPIWTYTHDVGNSITGGFVYRGSEASSLLGEYVYADFGSGKVWALTYDVNVTPSNEEILDTTLQIVSFGTDANNELYVLAFDGNIYWFGPERTGTTTTDITPGTGPDLSQIALVGAVLIGALGISVLLFRSRRSSE